MFKKWSCTFQILLINIYLLSIIIVVNGQDRKNLLSDPACGLYMYGNGGSAVFVGVTPANNKTERTTFELSETPRFFGKCNKSVNGIEEKEIKLFYQISNNEIIDKVNITMKISVAENVFWNISQIVVTVEGKSGYEFPKTEIPMSSKEIYLPDRFSYSCNEMQFRTRRNTENIELSIELRRFQLQPIGTAQKTIFYDSFDCSQWFTIPIWMGFITLLLFSLVVGMGICLLFDIKTMDRFEDPKGKMINVPVAE